MIDVSPEYDLQGNLKSGDLTVFNSKIFKASNVLKVQLGDLFFQQNFGIDKKFFFSSEFVFQNESFKTHLVEKLSEWNVDSNISSDLARKFMRDIEIKINDNDESGRLII